MPGEARLISDLTSHMKDYQFVGCNGSAVRHNVPNCMKKMNFVEALINGYALNEIGPGRIGKFDNSSNIKAYASQLYLSLWQLSGVSTAGFSTLAWSAVANWRRTHRLRKFDAAKTVE